jgi:dolichol-phosphate mannosyltransferase
LERTLRYEPFTAILQKIIPDFKNREKLITLIKFGMVGISGIIVNTGILWILHKHYGITIFIASPIAIAVAVFNNFTWNNLFTWVERRKNFQNRYLHRLLKYYISTSLGAAINYGILVLFFYLFGFNSILSNLIGIFVGMISNFILSDKWVFREP